MINRRKFVALLSSVPLLGNDLAAYLKPENQPPEFVRCNVCGEFNGSTETMNLS